MAHEKYFRKEASRILKSEFRIMFLATHGNPLESLDAAKPCLCSATSFGSDHGSHASGLSAGACGNGHGPSLSATPHDGTSGAPNYPGAPDERCCALCWPHCFGPCGPHPCPTHRSLSAADCATRLGRAGCLPSYLPGAGEKRTNFYQGSGLPGLRLALPGRPSSNPGPLVADIPPALPPFLPLSLHFAYTLAHGHPRPTLLSRLWLG